jgi:hypothetical protein
MTRSLITKELVAIQRHLYEVHCNLAALDLGFTEAQDQHYHEHFGPGGLRNHEHGPGIPAIEEPGVDQRDEALQQLVEQVNGFVYTGDRLNAIVEAVMVLRKDPGLAARILAPRRRIREGCCGQKLCIFDDRGFGQEGPCWESV